MRYQVVHSIQDKSLIVICRDEQFATLPDQIRYLGPWQGLCRGDILRLKSHYRLMLSEQGFALVYQPTKVFAPEA